MSCAERKADAQQMNEQETNVEIFIFCSECVILFNAK